MRSPGKFILLISMILATWLANVAHLGVAIPPLELQAPGKITGKWFPRKKYGLNHVFLWGSPFERGYTYGSFTKELLLRQEDSLVDKFNGFFPSRALQLGLLLGAKRWFWGIESFLDPEWLREMHGVSLSAPGKYDSFADPYTRQLAYHGLHEIGQMFVDYGSEGFGCTVLGVPSGNGWLIGRNFDFEGGRIFDEEKILKWVFPEKGIPFVSVIWAGMVGAVTGVNAKGVYISLNAAGSRDFARLGTPSTFILLKALETAATAEEAVEVFRKYSTIITEIFVAAGPGSPLYVIEKSPKRFFVHAHREPWAVANHLVDPGWAGDSINDFRREALTSAPRFERGLAIVREIEKQRIAQPLAFREHGVEWMLAGIRDKTIDGKEKIYPGNRASIDALIATHAVIFDTREGMLYVGTGPSLTGEFLGYDLAKSFQERRPVLRGELPPDTDVSREGYAKIKSDLQIYSQIIGNPKAIDCAAEKERLIALKAGSEHYLKYMAIAAIEDQCKGRGLGKASWLKASELKPAFEKERQLIKRNLP